VTSPLWPAPITMASNSDPDREVGDDDVTVDSLPQFNIGGVTCRCGFRFTQLRRAPGS